MRLHYITFHFVCHLNETNFGMDEYALPVVYVYVNVCIVRARFRLYTFICNNILQFVSVWFTTKSFDIGQEIEKKKIEERNKRQKIKQQQLLSTQRH